MVFTCSNAVCKRGPGRASAPRPGCRLAGRRHYRSWPLDVPDLNRLRAAALGIAKAVQCRQVVCAVAKVAGQAIRLAVLEIDGDAVVVVGPRTRPALGVGADRDVVDGLPLHEVLKSDFAVAMGAGGVQGHDRVPVCENGPVDRRFPRRESATAWAGVIQKQTILTTRWFRWKVGDLTGGIFRESSFSR